MVQEFQATVGEDKIREETSKSHPKAGVPKPWALGQSGPWPIRKYVQQEVSGGQVSDISSVVAATAQH